MYANIKSAVLIGLLGSLIEVECDLSRGQTAFNIVGLPDVAIRESKERVRTAIKNSDFRFPVKRITINLAPANTKKEGSHTDLAIAMSILQADGTVNSESSSSYIFLGELSLDGQITATQGVLPMVLSMRDIGYKKFIVPYENRQECSIVDDVLIIPVQTLRQCVEFLNGEIELDPCVAKPFESECGKYDVDFSDIKSQESMKRGLEIAAAGSHNVLMIGPPGSGKTMAARRIPTILPDLTMEESIEITKIYSVAGLTKSEGLMTARPFRSPHHTASNISLVGGGKIPKPGEVSLAHNGVLFLDELPEFDRGALEVLRQPIEDGFVSISRINAQISYPANFMFVASMNPCPCGYYGDPNHECTCTPYAIDRYLGKISNPLLDRIDLHMEVNAVAYADLRDAKPSESSAAIRERVNAARQRQIARYQSIGITNNANLSARYIQEYIHLDRKTEAIMNKAYQKYSFSARGYNKILKVARTIADLDDSDQVLDRHILEALRYRSFDSKYFS